MKLEIDEVANVQVADASYLSFVFVLVAVAIVAVVGAAIQQNFMENKKKKTT